MWKTIAQWLAKKGAALALSYLPDVALWAISQGAEKTQGETAQRVLRAVSALAADASLIAKSMEDGTISAEEAEALKARAEALAAELKGLL